jgi:hypothetical protein
VIVCQVIIPPPIGLADNGDFTKITGIFNLQPQVYNQIELFDQYFRYAANRYVTNPAYQWQAGFYSTETALAAIAVPAGKAWSRDGSFDIRFLGILHGILFMTAFTLALPLFRRFPTSSRLFLILMVIFVFCDTMYVEYYNSFYMDTAAYLFLLCGAVLFLRASHLPLSSGRTQFSFLICCCLFVLTKAQHAPLAIPLVILCLKDKLLLWPTRPIRSRSIAIVLLGICSLFAALSTPVRYTSGALYNVIFSSIIPSAGNPSKELLELGLNDSYLRYSGTNAYSPDSLLADSSAAATFSQMTSYRKLAIFYLRHPLRAAYVLHTGLNETASQRPKLFGNFDKRTGYPPHARSNRFSLWSSLKQNLFEQHGWGYLIYSLAMLGIVARYSRDYAACLALLTLSALAIGGLADNIETTRHLFVFNALLDLTFVFAVAGTLNTTSI